MIQSEKRGKEGKGKKQRGRDKSMIRKKKKQRQREDKDRRGGAWEKERHHVEMKTPKRVKKGSFSY